MTAQIGDIIRITTRLVSLNSGDISNVWHMELLGPSALSDEDIISDLTDWFDTAWDELDTSISEDVNFADINIFNVTQDTPLGSFPWPTLTSGSNQADPLPSQVSAFLQMPTGFSRSWGRKFLAGFTTDHLNTAGNIANAFLGVLEDFADQVLEGTGLSLHGSWQPVIWSGKYEEWKPILGWLIRNVWATVRTRRKGVGS